MPGVVRIGHAMFVEKADIELLISTGRGFQFNLFSQPILVIRAFPQHGTQDLQLIGEKLVCAFVQFRSQDNIETGRCQQHQQKAPQRICAGQTKRKCRAPARRAGALLSGFQGHSRHREPSNQLDGEGIVHFAAQSADIHIHDVGVAVEVHIPHQFSDQRPGQHFAGAPRQQGQQAETPLQSDRAYDRRGWRDDVSGRFQGRPCGWSPRIGGLIGEEASALGRAVRKTRTALRVIISAQIESTHSFMYSIPGSK